MPDQHLGFLESQVNRIERQAYMIRYPEIQYPKLVPVVRTGPEWIRGITYYSQDITGRAEFLAGRANDIPLADVTRDQHDVTVEMAGIGYDYSMEELQQARMIPGRNLTADKAIAARRAAEEFIDNLVLNGDADHGWDGLINNANVTNQTAATAQWQTLTGNNVDGIIRDINNLLSGLWTSSRTVEMADTLLLPPSAWSLLANQPRSQHTDMSILEWVRRYNLYTAQTGNPLMIQVVRGLEDAGASNVGRAIAYRRDPEVLRLHMPMPHRFLAPQRWIMRYIVPGILRLGGLEIRLPGAMRYMDNITG